MSSFWPRFFYRRLLVRMVNVVKRLKDYKTAQLIEKELL